MFHRNCRLIFSVRFYALLACIVSPSLQQTKASNDQLMMCRPVDNSQRCSAPSIIPTQGRPGKRGAKGDQGIPGERGEKGSQGIVNYSTINNEIDQRIDREMAAYKAELDAKHERLERTFQESLENIRRTIDKRSVYCPLKYQRKCFWVKVNSGRGIRLAEARKICSNIGAELANVYSETHYYELMNHIRSIMLGDYAELYLGMKINTRSRVTSLSDGRRAPFVKWHPGYPSSSRGIYVQVAVNQSPLGTNQGLFHYGASNPLYGVVCEMDEA